MGKRSERDLSRIGWLDYVLMSIGSCLAVFAAGMSIQQPTISYFSVILVIVGTAFSYGVRSLTIKSAWIKFDGMFYALAVMAAIFESNELRDMMPEGGFPREIAAAGWLTWMLILGSFATWQDATLLFQAIPALALFGLIGCYDTYRAVTFAFFAFLICLATLFARAHGREMLRKAAESGYFTRGLAPGTPIPSVETTPGLALLLRKGPWRWIAGPEWALASALVVVMVSLLGAPVIRRSVAGVSGFVKLNTPPIKANSTTASASTQVDVIGQNVRIGRPFNHALERNLISAKLDRVRYLRTETYDYYGGHGWVFRSNTTPAAGGSTLAMRDLVRDEIKNPERHVFDIQTFRSLPYAPTPLEPTNVTIKGGDVEPRNDGPWQVTASGNINDGYQIRVETIEPPARFTPREKYGGSEMEPYLVIDNIPVKVQDLAKSIVQNSKTDYAKADRIQQEVSSRILYNLDAEETPADKDPVEYALFEQKEAYCPVFASAMVLMARSVGLPARYVQGYLPDERRHERNGPYILTDADYHAWCEIFFKDAGWVIFDPTIGAAWKDGEGLGDRGDPRPWYRKGAMLVALDALIVLVVGVLSLAGYRQFRAYRRYVNHRSELDRVYILFSRSIERLTGRRRPIGSTADEFLESARPTLGATYEAAQDLNRRLVTAMYSPESVGPELVAKLRVDLDAFKKALKRLPRANSGEA